MIRKTLLPILFTPIALTNPAVAQTETVSTVVSYADLNLGSQEGIAMLDRRIARAIRDLCGPYPGSPSWNLQVRRCRAEARASAHPQRELALRNAGAIQVASYR